MPPVSVDAQTILDSYDPFADTAPLKASPEDFDRLRAAYAYRSEPHFKLPE